MLSLAVQCIIRMADCGFKMECMRYSLLSSGSRDRSIEARQVNNQCHGHKQLLLLNTLKIKYTNNGNTFKIDYTSNENQTN